MAEPAYPNNETRFSEYPEPRGRPRIAESRYPPAVAGSRSNPALNNAAENIGSTLGNAVETVKQLPDRMQEMKERFTVIRGRAQEDAATRASDMAEQVKEQAQRQLTVARNRAQRLAHSQPLRFIAAAAAFGFVLGIVLRIWRDHAD